MSNIVELGISPKQISKLRNGHRVRVKKGTGICLIVKPENYNIITRAFNKGKGVEISLNPEELMANAQSAEEMEGRGIFGKKFDRGVGKLIGKKNRKALYGELESRFKEPIKKVIKKAQDYAPELGASPLSGLAVALGNPELAIPAGAFGAKLGKKVGDMGGKFATDYLENPSAYNSKRGSKQITQQNLNAMLGTNSGYLERAGLANAKALYEQAQVEKERLEASGASGRGLWSGGGGSEGSGLYLGRGEGMYAGRGFRATGGQLGGSGQRVLPQALTSQPFSANFQFRYSLPPAYQKIGSGMYA